MLVDPRAIARRCIAELAVGLCLLAGSCYAGTRAAWGQALEPVLPAGHPVDWLSALYGGGGTGAMVAVVVAVLWVLNKAGVPVGISIGKRAQEPAAAPAAALDADNFDKRLDAVEKDVARLVEAQKHFDANQTRTLLEVQGVRDLAQQILLRHIKGGSGE